MIGGALNRTTRLDGVRLQDLERVEAEAFGIIELRGATAPESRLDQLAREHDLDRLEHEILLTLAAAAIDPSVDDALTQASPWRAPRGHDVAGLAQVVAPDQLQRQLDVLVRLGPDARLVKAVSFASIAFAVTTKRTGSGAVTSSFRPVGSRRSSEAM